MRLPLLDLLYYKMSLNKNDIRELLDMLEDDYLSDRSDIKHKEWIKEGFSEAFKVLRVDKKYTPNFNSDRDSGDDEDDLIDLYEIK